MDENRIRQQRQDFGMTQREFAVSTGIPLGTLRNWEQGKNNPPEYLYPMLYELLRRNSMLNVKTLKVIAMLNELAKKEANGISEFKAATKDNKESCIFYDAASCTRREDGALLYKVAEGVLIEPESKHHDIVSYYGDEEEDFDVMVVDDNEGEPFLEVHLLADDEYVEFGGGEWYFS